MSVLTDAEIKKKLLDFVEEQAKDDAIWFIADSIVEAYLQQEIRRLHALIEELCQ